MTQSPPSGTPRKTTKIESTQYLSPYAQELGEKSLSASRPPGQPVVMFSVKICLTQSPKAHLKGRRGGKSRQHTVGLPLECNLRLQTWQVAHL